MAAFARRQWADPQRRLEYWREQYRLEGPAAARKAAAALYEHAQRVGSVVFSDSYREQDFIDHLRLRERLDRAAPCHQPSLVCPPISHERSARSTCAGICSARKRHWSMDRHVLPPMWT